MTFANWKKRSKLFQAYFDRSEREGIALEDACASAYKAGQRDKMKVTEASLEKAYPHLRVKLRGRR